LKVGVLTAETAVQKKVKIALGDLCLFVADGIRGPDNRRGCARWAVGRKSWGEETMEGWLARMTRTG